MNHRNILIILGIVILLGGVYLAVGKSAPTEPVADVPDVEVVATSTEEVATTTVATSTEPKSLDDIPFIGAPQAQVSTEGWKTCRNEEYGYEFMYPGDWVIFRPQRNFDPIVIEKCIDELTYVAPKDSYDSGGVGVIPTPTALGTGLVYEGIESINEFLLRGTTKEQEDRLNKIESLGLIGGEDAVWYKDQNSTRIKVYYSDTLFTIASNSSDIDTLTTILSTFTFLDQ